MGLSQEGLAEKVGISAHSIKMIENGSQRTAYKSGGLIRQYEKRLLTPVGHNSNYMHTSTNRTLHYVHTLYLRSSFSQ